MRGQRWERPKMPQIDRQQAADRPQAEDARRSGVRPSPLVLGLLVAAGTVVFDQALKLWLLFGFDLETRTPVRVTPFFDLVSVWNTGISYGLFPQNGPVGQLLLLAFKAAAVALLSVWLSRAGTRLTAIALGLIIGGAIGNAIDRLAFGAVFDFVLLHLTTVNFSLRWYVFNLADVAIVAGVIGLLYEALFSKSAVKAP